jgi:deoxyribodipyrimidine photo-lyase
MSLPLPSPSAVPAIRIRTLNPEIGDFNPEGDYVLYWMIAARRTNWNFGLQRAVEWARSLKKPLLILEALRSGYKWNSDRIHGFVIQGMADNARRLADKPVTYYPYLETSPGQERGLLPALAREACLIVTDDFPCFFLPRMLQVASRLTQRTMELVDSNGLYPMHHTQRVFSRAFDFRRHLQKELLPHLRHAPLADPLANLQLPRLKKLPENVIQRWPEAKPLALARSSESLNQFLMTIPLNHQVPLCETVGGSVAAEKQAELFIAQRLSHYQDARNEPEKMMTSQLSPYLHFGHISVHQIFDQLQQRCQWLPGRTAAKATGQASGWWGMDQATESFLDEIITWREIGYNMCAHTDNFDRYESLPSWARKTLEEHQSDPRDYLYDFEQFETSQTHDRLWNAAQNQLRRTGIIHNYLRMLWGKKILEWSPSPADALATMIELNNKWALDGRNPNSYSGIFWVLGRYDRAWGERPVFGKIRYMSSENTARKVKVKNYIDQFRD